MRHEIHIRGLDLVEKPHDEKLELVERKASILEKNLKYMGTEIISKSWLRIKNVDYLVRSKIVLFIE